MQKTKIYGANAAAVDRHHLLFQGRFWNIGAGKCLRGHFVYCLPLETHRDLHNYVLRDVPRPPGVLVSYAWNKYKAERREVERMDIFDAIMWLEETIPDEKFIKAMQIQYDFLSEELARR